MRKHIFCALILVLLSACSQAGFFAHRDDVSEWSQPFSFAGDGAAVAINPATDIIFLLDNSGSMQDEVGRLRSALTELQGSLANEKHVDYRVYGLNFWNMWATNGVMDVSFDGGYSDRNSFAPFETFLNSDSFGFHPHMDSYTIHNGIALAGGALREQYHLNPDVTRVTKNVEFVMVSDEDNDLQKYVHPLTGEVAYENYRDYLMVGPNTYNYRVNYETGKTRLNVSNRCLVSPNTYNAAAGENYHRYYCKASGEEGQFSYSTFTHIADVPSSYLCMMTSDNHTQEVVSWQYSTGCRLNPNATYSRRLTTQPTVPGVTNAVPVTCREQWYQPIVIFNGNANYNYTSPVSSMTIAACRSGFAPTTVQNSNSNYHVDLAPSFVAPNGVTVGPAPRTSTNFNSQEFFATDDEVIAAYRAINPSALNIAVESRPETGLVQEKQYYSTPQGFGAMLREKFPHLKVAFNAIIAKKDGACVEGEQTNNVEGKRYKLVAEMTKGFIGDICDVDFKPLMKKLASNVLFNSRPQYALARFANPDAILEVVDLNLDEKLFEGEHYEITPDRLHIRFIEGAVDITHRFMITQIRK